jgi:hypothetical protein
VTSQIFACLPLQFGQESLNNTLPRGAPTRERILLKSFSHHPALRVAQGARGARKPRIAALLDPRLTRRDFLKAASLLATPVAYPYAANAAAFTCFGWTERPAP